jgi:hypothetical protein
MRFKDYLQEVEMSGQPVAGSEQADKKKVSSNPQLEQDINDALELTSLLANSKNAIPDGFFKYKYEYGLMNNKYPAVLKTTIVSGRPFNIKDVFAIVVNGKVFGTKNTISGVQPDLSHGMTIEKFKSAIVKR